MYMYEYIVHICMCELYSYMNDVMKFIFVNEKWEERKTQLKIAMAVHVYKYNVFSITRYISLKCFAYALVSVAIKFWLQNNLQRWIFIVIFVFVNRCISISVSGMYENK